MIKNSALLALCAAVLPAFADESSGSTVFAARCAVCHGSDAAGIPGSFPSLHEQVIAFSKTPQGRDYLVMVLTTGLVGELKVDGVTYRGVMPPQSGLSEVEVAGALSYLAANRGKDAGSPVITAKDVQEARSRHPGSTSQTTYALRPAPNL